MSISMSARRDQEIKRSGDQEIKRSRDQESNLLREHDEEHDAKAPHVDGFSVSLFRGIVEDFGSFWSGASVSGGVNVGRDDVIRKPM